MRFAAGLLLALVVGLDPSPAGAAPVQPIFYYPVYIQGYGVVYIPVHGAPAPQAQPQPAPQQPKPVQAAHVPYHPPAPQIVAQPQQTVPSSPSPSAAPAAPAPASSQTPAVAPATPDISALEMRIVALINQQRTAQGLKALQPNAKLMTVARTHSENMVKYNFFNHTSDGNPGDRMHAAGYSWQTYGENIFMGGGALGTPEQAVVAWMNSPGHRANILNPAFTETGVGVALGANGVLYYTQDFGTPAN